MKTITVTSPAKLPHRLLLQLEFGEAYVSEGWGEEGKELYPSQGGKTELVVKKFESASTLDVLKWCKLNGFEPANAQDTFAFACTDEVQDVISLGTIWKIKGREMVSWVLKGKSDKVHLNQAPLEMFWRRNQSFLLKKVSK